MCEHCAVTNRTSYVLIKEILSQNLQIKTLGTFIEIVNVLRALQTIEHLFARINEMVGYIFR